MRPQHPILGNFLAFSRIMRNPDNYDYIPWQPMLETLEKEGKLPELVGIMMQSQAVLVLNTPQPFTDLYVQKNRYFEKDPIGRIVFKPFFGESLVFVDGDESWSHKRKTMSAAFYKEKLIKMTEVVREVVTEKISEIEERYVKTGKPMNVTEEMGELQNRIFLTSVFGLKDLHKVRLPYLQRGQTLQLDIGDFLRRLVGFLLLRQGRRIFGLIPYLLFFNYTKEDREYVENIRVVRTYCEGLIEDRKKNMSKFSESSDLMNIWLTDDSYKNNTKLIVDEIILMFLAGSFTLKTTNTNMLSYLAMNPDVKAKLVTELKETILKEHL